MAYFIPSEGLSNFPEPVIEHLGECTWPPAGYDGAEDDAALAQRLAELLKPACESSESDCPYQPFVIAPEDAAPEDFREDLDIVPVLAEPPEEDEPWDEFWGEAEYSARKAADELMWSKLDQVDSVAEDVDDVLVLVTYSGRSSTGAEVGVLAFRTET